MMKLMNTSPAPRTLTRRAMMLSTAAAVTSLTAFGKFGKIDLGVCGKPADFAKTAEYGYDYFEPSAAALAAMTDTAFSAFKDQVQASKTKCDSVNILFSGQNQKVVGTDVNLDAICTYLDSTFDRCKAVGTSVVVWGSSGSRRVPDGYSRDTAWQQIVDYLKRAGPIAKAKGLVIGIEPLRKQESNIINTGAEALKLVHDVNHPNVKMIIDYYHMRIENEDPEIVRTAKDEIVHLHFANPAGRRWPHSADEDPVYAKFFEIVKAIKYQGGLSIEGTGTFEADGAASMAFFKSFLA
jgi:D-psicose/D-tagatose/L-ribulose 3-epimerase